MSSTIKGVPAPGYNPISASDYIPQEKMREIQLERFIRVVKNAYENVPLYRQRFDEAHFDVNSFKSLEDVKKLLEEWKKQGVVE